MHISHSTYWQIVWKQFCRQRLGVIALIIIMFFVIVGIYAPFLASDKPLIVQFHGTWYFPLFRYLFYPHFFTKSLDIFYNLLMFTFPLFILAWIGLRHFPVYRFWVLMSIATLHLILFGWILLYPPKDPSFNSQLSYQRQQQIQTQMQILQISPLLASSILPDWSMELRSLNAYAQLNLVLHYQQTQLQHKRLEIYQKSYEEQAKLRGQNDHVFPTLWNLNYQQEQNDKANQFQILEQLKSQYPNAKATLTLIQQSCQPTQDFSFSSFSPLIICDFLNHLSHQDRDSFLKNKAVVDQYEKAEAQLKYLQDRNFWLEQQVKQLQYEIMPLLRSFHWENDAGGDQILNHFVSWWDLTRINRKDLIASLIFGIRISLSVGLLAIGLALLIGIPVGAIAGYYGGKLDLIVYRLIEIWESMPTFFMLLMIVAFLQSKSIFLIIAVIGLFGWTGFSRFIRGEFFRQKQLLYVEACHALGYPDKKIIFSHLLPNAIPPLLTLIPFAIMGAITNEAALSFLGLGEEGSNSWGVLMDEGRSAFPSESYLLWPPAILLTILLVAIAIMGDHLRDALDPKLHNF